MASFVKTSRTLTFFIHKKDGNFNATLEMALLFKLFQEVMRGIGCYLPLIGVI